MAVKKDYSKMYCCGNCNHCFTKYFGYGEVANKGKCPRCGVSDEDLRQNGIWRR